MSRLLLGWVLGIVAVIAFAVTIVYAFNHEASPTECVELEELAGLLEECRL